MRRPSPPPSAPQSVVDPSALAIPERLGYITETFNPEPDGSLPKKLVIHLQDAHVQEGAQRALAELIDALHRSTHVSVVAMEGGAGPGDTSFFSAFPDKQVNSQLADFFLRQGLFAGPVFYAVTHPGTVRLHGVEDQAIYLDHLAAYQAVAAVQHQAVEQIGRLVPILKARQDTLYSEELRMLTRHVTDYARERITLSDYVRYLAEVAATHHVSLASYPQLDRLVRLVRLEHSLDRAAHLESLRLSEEIQETQVPAELDQLVAALKDRLFTTPDQRSLDRLLTTLEVLSELYAARLSPDQYERFLLLRPTLTADAIWHDLTEITKHHIPITKQAPSTNIQAPNEDQITSYQLPITERELQLLLESLPTVERFYELARRRDDALVRNTLALLAQGARLKAQGHSSLEPRTSNLEPHAVILVTGGFHTPGLTQRLKAQGVAYVVISPAIGEEPRDADQYRRLVLNRVPSLEELITALTTEVARQSRRPAPASTLVPAPGVFPSDQQVNVKSGPPAVGRPDHDEAPEQPKSRYLQEAWAALEAVLLSLNGWTPTEITAACAAVPALNEVAMTVTATGQAQVTVQINGTSLTYQRTGETVRFVSSAQSPLSPSPSAQRADGDQDTISLFAGQPTAGAASTGTSLEAQPIPTKAEVETQGQQFVRQRYNEWANRYVRLVQEAMAEQHLTVEQLARNLHDFYVASGRGVESNTSDTNFESRYLPAVAENIRTLLEMKTERTDQRVSFEDLAGALRVPIGTRNTPSLALVFGSQPLARMFEDEAARAGFTDFVLQEDPYGNRRRLIGVDLTQSRELGLDLKKRWVVIPNRLRVLLHFADSLAQVYAAEAAPDKPQIRALLTFLLRVEQERSKRSASYLNTWEAEHPEYPNFTKAPETKQAALLHELATQSYLEALASLHWKEERPQDTPLITIARFVWFSIVFQSTYPSSYRRLGLLQQGNRPILDEAALTQQLGELLQTQIFTTSGPDDLPWIDVDVKDKLIDAIVAFDRALDPLRRWPEERVSLFAGQPGPSAGQSAAEPFAAVEPVVQAVKAADPLLVDLLATRGAGMLRLLSDAQRPLVYLVGSEAIKTATGMATLVTLRRQITASGTTGLVNLVYVHTDPDVSQADLFAGLEVSAEELFDVVVSASPTEVGRTQIIATVNDNLATYRRRTGLAESLLPSVTALRRENTVTMATNAQAPVPVEERDREARIFTELVSEAIHLVVQQPDSTDADAVADYSRAVTSTLVALSRSQDAPPQLQADIDAVKSVIAEGGVLTILPRPSQTLADIDRRFKSARAVHSQV